MGLEPFDRLREAMSFPGSRKLSDGSDPISLLLKSVKVHLSHLEYT